ncbi:sensor histidine kinase [Flavobacterium sp. SOK18b]|uniref:sensor histidine kinase n=1 Tax=Flavobacterium sp. SOK18b TaxID=797900 RepID=UPI0015FE4253|nr:HAMP domain-containing sensor histidine kinase [Flavobacterium sp. SOK18b]MBB1193988.1 sensor histidine kinase [Flavobacterium sp. SOK18b]
MKLYEKLNAIPFLRKKYASKFLFVAFLGIHIPLIGVSLFLLFGNQELQSIMILVVTLIFTLLATLITLLVLKKLIKPIELASSALVDYRNNRIIPNLPTHFQDETGLLLANIQSSIADYEAYINDKQDLIYLLSHDLRGFAANSQGLSTLILNENPSELIAEYSNLITDSTNQQLAFIETLITLIRDEDEISKKEYFVNQIDFNTVLSKVSGQLAAKLISKNCTLEYATQLPTALIHLDEDLLVRVLINLTDNAIKFSFPDSIIRINLIQDDKTILIQVTDTGLGFKSQDIEHLFDKFTSKSRLGTNNEASTGIGLYLCKKIIEKYKGHIYAESNGMNQGSTFSVRLDLK